MKKAVTISLDKLLNDRWSKVAKKHGLFKSGMIEEFLNEVVPVLEQETPTKILSSAMKRMAKEMDATANLFDVSSAETVSVFDDQK